jgi:hypothetical protein
LMSRRLLHVWANATETNIMCAENLEKARAAVAKWRDENPQKARAAMSRWQKENPKRHS